MFAWFFNVVCCVVYRCIAFCVVCLLCVGFVLLVVCCRFVCCVLFVCCLAIASLGVVCFVFIAVNYCCM